MGKDAKGNNPTGFAYPEGVKSEEKTPIIRPAPCGAGRLPKVVDPK
jgi:hypothetical protein